MPFVLYEKVGLVLDCADCFAFVSKLVLQNKTDLTVEYLDLVIPEILVYSSLKF